MSRPAPAASPPRGAEIASRSLVGSRVAFAYRGLAGVRMVESVLVALAAFGAALATAVVSGASLEAGDPWGVAATCSVLAGLTWALEHRRLPRQVARTLDQELQEDGALFTAWELEGRGEGGELGLLLGRHVAARHSARSMLHAILPATAPVLALPFLAAAALFLALEQARFEPRLEDLATLSARVGEELSELAAADAGAVPQGAEELSQAELAELAGVARDAARLEQAVRQGEGQAEVELAEFRDRLDELEARAPAGSALREQLQRAATTLDSALMALERPELPRDAEQGPGGAGGGGSRGASPGSEVARGEGDGTMVGFQPPPSPPEGVAPTSSDADRTGVLSGPAWPEAFDGIVGRWVETRRARDAAR